MPTEEEIAMFAAAWGRDSINKYNYDGMDIDYEPGYGASGPLVGNPCPELFNVLIRELGKYLGPKSGTGKLLMIDGVPYAVWNEMAEYFDYGIVQAYASYGYTDLQNRFNSAYNVGWKPEQYIFAENFESYWKNGGVTHTTREGETVNSLLGMARFNPEQGFCAGFGAYHMEYEYAQSAMPYMYMRRAIQDVNPAGGEISVSLSSSQLERFPVLVSSDGSLSGTVETSVSLNFKKPVPEDVTFDVVLDNSLVSEYNLKNGTSYLEGDPSNITLSPITAVSGAIVSEAVAISYDPSGHEPGVYLLPVVVRLPEDGQYISSEPLVKYLLVSLASMDIDMDATALTGTKIEPNGWTIVCYQAENDSGANGVWNLDTDEQKAKMFDGQTGSGWYGNAASYSWGTGGNFIVTLDKAYDMNGFRWHYYTGGVPVVNDILYSADGSSWSSLTNASPITPNTQSDDSKWMVFQFTKTVEAKYIRVYVAPLNSMCSMDEIEFYAPSN